MRSIWNGAISFGLVSIPIKLVNATENHSISFRQIHTEDGGRIRYRKFCELEDREVSSQEIGKGYEDADGTIIPITDDHHDYARRIETQLCAAGVRAAADLGSERMSSKIRQAQLMRVPYMLIVGDQEMANETVSIRYRNGEQQNDQPVGEFVAHVQRQIQTRSAEL